MTYSVIYMKRWGRPSSKGLILIRVRYFLKVKIEIVLGSQISSLKSLFVTYVHFEVANLCPHLCKSLHLLKLRFTHL